MSNTPFGTGRIYVEDDRDWPLRSSDLQPQDEESEISLDRGWRYWWQDGFWGNQKDTSQCVCYSWIHVIEDGPTTHAPRTPQREAQHRFGAKFDPVPMYRWCQRNDQWAGESPDYEGTSVRAGAKFMKANHVLSEYRWASNGAEVAHAVLTVGPVVLGTLWTPNMFEVDNNGFIHVGQPTDQLYGHAYVVNGVNLEEGKARIKNSWGRTSWGVNGNAWIELEELDWLVRSNGEACVPIELRSD